MRFSKNFFNVIEGNHQSVTKMVRDLLPDDPDFVKEFESRIIGRELVKALTIVRCKAGITQQQLAEKMGCGQSKLSKLESGFDADLRFGDVLAYLKAIGFSLKLTILPHVQPESSPVVQVEALKPSVNDDSGEVNLPTKKRSIRKTKTRVG
ncbi:MAG TPA: helix-turn-helix transcriptional regulator [Gemmata sp.]|jgi:transcriptional regulator with XRE-family HTH domain|nr:helix-turn-helix transcriptional regulator [Gemmata sp.]